MPLITASEDEGTETAHRSVIVYLLHICLLYTFTHKTTLVEFCLVVWMMAVCSQAYTKAPISTTIFTPHTLLATRQGLSPDQRARLKFPYVTLNNRASQHDAISVTQYASYPQTLS